MKCYSRSITSIIFLLVLFVNCNNNQNELHTIFLPWNSYMVYNEGESPYLQLCAIFYGKEMSDAKVINACKDKIFFFESSNIKLQGKLANLNFGSLTDNYILATLEFFLEPAPPGELILTDLSIADIKSNKERYSIGTWKILTLESTEKKSLEIGKSIFLSYEFDAYVIELFNISEKPIVIHDLELDIEIDDLKIYMAVSDDFNIYPDSRGVLLPYDNAISGFNILPPGDSRAFFFTFSFKSSTDTNSNYITLKPILIYSQTSVLNKEVLPIAIYSYNLSEPEIMEIIQLDNQE